MSLAFARSIIVNSAKAYGLEAIDMVCLEYMNMEKLKEECSNGRSFGFSGKQVIHPAQIEMVNKAFSPNPEGIQFINDASHHMINRD